MKRSVGYRWRLCEVMAQHGMFRVNDLIPHLAERGITLSTSQVHRLVSGTPERLSLPVLAALCDIFALTPSDLIVTTAENVVRPRAASTAEGGPVVDLADLRPTRARIHPEP
ncbi:helix-turn-helix transcriptional regulator [Nonomuraea sp. NEAU-A123]|uniref:helix-turn-helix domain-containing protein n=1 Tax=Nonomuraea sp. NEAU-A123 TaxID=2839649 RepID=UPI001BE472DD|nr:helix-turn-helix transcriptional regulator [Nonomuraea sp. NEAU-A123]MBT2235782.1 helix-turn-helix domain-containing protein [Nonomuraea sp. NEAU-A123]